MKNGRSQGWCTAVTCGANQHVNEVESGKVDINNKCVDNPPPASEPGNDEPAPAASPASPTDPSSPAGPDTPGASANPTAPEDPETPENPNASGITPDGREPAGGTGNTGGEDADVPADTPPAGNTEPDTPPAASVVPESSEEVARRKQEEEKAESQAKIDALQEKADEAKKREQSTANKLLGGAAIGATGIGMQNLLEGKAEQSADEDAERAMKAYLETFTCDYGQGRNIKGGQMEIELPGATQLFEQVNEYKVLAADLKARKEALGLRAGIESEVILDKAETGLYDDAGVGITGGAYTSLSRALQDPTGKDAADLAQQKSDASSKVKTGAITAGAGAIGGAVGNLIINRDKDDANKKDDK